MCIRDRSKAWTALPFTLSTQEPKILKAKFMYLLIETNCSLLPATEKQRHMLAEACRRTQVSLLKTRRLKSTPQMMIPNALRAWIKNNVEEKGNRVGGKDASAPREFFLEANPVIGIGSSQTRRCQTDSGAAANESRVQRQGVRARTLGKTHPEVSAAIRREIGDLMWIVTTKVLSNPFIELPMLLQEKKEQLKPSNPSWLSLTQSSVSSRKLLRTL
eukprot:TRINITY_DN12900_c0_g1_i1.p3 TRINITY_DN12900_c0_g1~~TRINITY_DN12900_c0_g1_i1.p3  ORF type:complete len:217 (+),score=24.13 TRINITY_DN12900_c0_g1_i1:64-714(+)